MSADTFILLSAIFMLVVMRRSTCPMYIYGISIIVIPYTDKSLNFIIVMERKSVYFHISGYFAPVDMPAVILPEFL